MKFLKKNAVPIGSTVLAVGLISCLDWNWASLQSFLTGGLIAALATIQFFKED